MPEPGDTALGPAPPRGFSADAGRFGHGQFAPGTVLAGRYRVVGLLGRGGMGEVYRADDLTLGQSVAIKLLPDRLDRDPAALARLLEEVRTARQVSHPNVCRVHDLGEVDGRRFLSMEYIDGEDLSILLRRIGHLPQDKGLEIARQICAGLAAAHDRGVLHRDLKPANIMIDGRGRVRITDFGLATALGGDATRAGEVAGTPVYMAPEQFEGQPLSIQSDLYALGLVLFELFTGRRFHDTGDIAELRARHQQQASGRLSASGGVLDPAVSRVVERCLDPDPHRRPSSAIQVAAALPGGDPLAAALAAGETPSPQMVAVAGDRGGLSPRTAALLCAVFVASFAAFAVVQEGWSEPRLLGLSKSPDVLAARARDTLDQLGFPNRSVDHAGGFHLRPEEVEDARRHPGDDLRLALARRHPSPAYFWYREDRQPLRAPLLFAFGDPASPFPLLRSALPVTAHYPPRESGSLYVELAPDGRLECLDARLAEPDIATEAERTDWPLAFKLAGLDINVFGPAEPQPLPGGAADTRLAWTERAGQAGLHVEAASLRGQPVFFRVMSALTPADIAPAPVERGPRALLWGFYPLLVVMVISAIAFMRRNLTLGRGDRAGATRLALLVGFATLLSAALSASWPSDGLVQTMMSGALSAAMFIAGCCWVFYVAIEPYARRQWPRTLTGWTRFIHGEWRDPAAGRELLIGAAIGIALLAVERAIAGTPFSFRQPGRSGLELDAYGSVLGALSVGVNQIGSVVSFNLGWIVLLLLGRRVTRRDVLALGIPIFLLAAVFTSMATALSLPQHLWLFGIVVVRFAVSTVLYLRVGFLALVAHAFTMAVLSVMPLSFTSGSYFAGLAWLAVAVASAPALFGLYTSLAGQSVFLNAPEDR